MFVSLISDTLSLIGKFMYISLHPEVEHVMEVHGVGEELWQSLVNVQYSKPPEVVTTTAEVLDELGLKEEATQLRGQLVFIR